jgi:hypothetical protein
MYAVGDVNRYKRVVGSGPMTCVIAEVGCVFVWLCLST